MGGASWVGRGLGKVGGGDTQEGRGGVSRIGRDLRRNGLEETTTRGGASGKWAGHPEDGTEPPGWVGALGVRWRTAYEVEPQEK